MVILWNQLIILKISNIIMMMKTTKIVDKIWSWSVLFGGNSSGNQYGCGNGSGSGYNNGYGSDNRSNSGHGGGYGSTCYIPLNGTAHGYSDIDNLTEYGCGSGSGYGYGNRCGYGREYK